MKDLLVIKLGGSAGIELAPFLDSLVATRDPYVLVHGANVELDALMRRVGVEPRTVHSSTGQVSRFTDEQTMNLFLMAYAGKANKRIVESLQGRGVNAVGLTGLDGGTVRGRRKPRIRVVENGKAKILDGDYAGSIEEVDTRLVELLLKNGYVPVLTPPAVSFNGEAINVDGDKLAMELACALRASKLLLFSNTAGLLESLDNPESTIPIVYVDQLDDSLTCAQGRMKKKVLAAADAVIRGIPEVILADANAEDAVGRALAGAGTHFRSSRSMGASPALAVSPSRASDRARSPGSS